jgi:SAM-dependent methyltransferase
VRVEGQVDDAGGVETQLGLLRTPQAPDKEASGYEERERSRDLGHDQDATEAQLGRTAIARAKLDARIRIAVQSYDTPPEETYDIAIAIESLAHSPDPRNSLRAIGCRLAPGALFAIVDDMPHPAARGTRDLAAFQAGWQLPVLCTGDELLAALHECGFVLVQSRDLTAGLRPRDERRIAALERLNRLAWRCAPTAGLRAMLDSYHGGLALERLYRHSLREYRLVVARKGYAAAERGATTNAAS